MLTNPDAISVQLLKNFRSAHLSPLPFSQVQVVLVTISRILIPNKSRHIFLHSQTLSALSFTSTPIPNTSLFSRSQYASLQSHITQQNRLYKPLPTRLYCKTNSLHPPSFFASLFLRSHTAFPIRLSSPLLPAALSILYLLSITYPTHSKEPRALFPPAIALRLSVQFCPPYLN